MKSCFTTAILMIVVTLRLSGLDVICMAKEYYQNMLTSPVQQKGVLIISEVTHPNDIANAKYVELYNSGSTTVDFSTEIWYLSRQSNGSTWGDVLLSGSVGPGESFVVANNVSTFNSAFGFDPDQASGIVTGNGDDGYFLFKDGNHSTGTLFDAYGVIDQDGTGEPWEYTHTKAIRNYNVTSSNTTWTASEWTIPSISETYDMTPTSHRDDVTWDGSSSGDWHTKDNWTFPGTHDFIPDVSDNLTVPVGLTNYPTINGEEYCHDITLQSNANGNASILGNENLTVNGTATIQRYMTGGTNSLLRDDPNAVYHFASSPVASTTAINVFPGTAYVRQWNETIQEWENLTGSDILQVGKGYSVWLAGGTATVSFSGTLNAVDVSPTITFTTGGTPNPSYDGYNLAGNPFPSGLDWDLGNWTKTNIDATIAIWSGSGGNYLYWNGSTGGIANGIIPPTQGFFIKANAPGPVLTIPNDARVHCNTTYYKNNTVVDDLLVVNVEGSENEFKDAVYINFNDQATVGYDSQYDGLKLWGLEFAPQIYSKISDELFLAINTLPSITSSETVPVSFMTGYNGCFTITAEGIDSFDPLIPIYLEDLKATTIVNLRQNPSYQFNYSTLDDPDRFVIHFSDPLNVEYLNNNEDIAIYAFENEIIINSPTTNGEIVVYNLLGQVVARKNIENNRVRITLNKTNAYYIVKVITEKGVRTEKVFVR